MTEGKLRANSVAPALVRGDKFLKWDDVSGFPPLRWHHEGNGVCVARGLDQVSSSQSFPTEIEASPDLTPSSLFLELQSEMGNYYVCSHDCHLLYNVVWLFRQITFSLPMIATLSPPKVVSSPNSPLWYFSPLFLAYESFQKNLNFSKRY